MIVVVVVAMGGAALAQFGFGGFNGLYQPLPNIPYDGRFTFVRVRYDTIFKGIFEDNDRRKRLMVIINYNTDVSQFWEWSGRGLRPFDQTNEAYKLGVNYMIYGLTY